MWQFKSCHEISHFFSCCVVQIRNRFVLNNLMGACCNIERDVCCWLLNYRDREEGVHENTQPESNSTCCGVGLKKVINSLRPFRTVTK